MPYVNNDVELVHEPPLQQDELVTCVVRKQVVIQAVGTPVTYEDGLGDGMPLVFVSPLLQIRFELDAGQNLGSVYFQSRDLLDAS